MSIEEQKSPGATTRRINFVQLLPILITVCLTAMSTWTITVASATTLKTTVDSLVTENARQNDSIDAVTAKNNEISNRLSSIETAQKFQTDLIKDIRDDVREATRNQEHREDRKKR